MFSQIEPNQNVSDSSVIAVDSIKIDTVQREERLEDVLAYNSDDQIHEWRKKMSYLMRNAVVNYTDMEIRADYVEINWETGDVYADGKRDSTGMIIEPTIFKQAGKEYEQHSFKVNFKTKVGVAYNVRINEGEGVLVGNRVKRANDSLMYIRGADYTTDTYFIERKTEEPDYVLRASRAKFIDGKKNKVMITGPINMRIYDVPTPLTLPFAYLPMGDTRSAGIIIPSFGERTDVGFFLEGMGFYLPIGDYLDLAVTGGLYTKGSWQVRAASAYRKKYRFNGSFAFDYQNRVTGIKGLDNYSKSTTYALTWNHSQDAKANPNLTFNIGINYRSSTFYRDGINNNNIINGNIYDNNSSSSISINKIFPNSPFSLAVTANNNLNFNTGDMLFTLPQLTFNMSRIYPFAPKVGSKKGLLNNLAVGYNLNVINSINTTEEEAFTSRMWDNAKNGAKHAVTLNTGVTLGSYFPVSFSAGYDEVWALKTIDRRYDFEERKIVDTNINGFDAYREFNMGTSVSTNLYGTYISKNENATIKGIRHVISPTVGFSYRPDFGAEEWGYYTTYRGADGKRVIYSRFDNGAFAPPSRGQNAGLNFSLRNNLEMKVRSKSDSTGFKKIKIFEYLDISSSYNLAAESFKMGDISVSGMTRLFDQFNLQFRASFSPYKIVFEDGSTRGTEIDKIGAFRLTGYNVNFGYNFDNKTFGGGEMDSKKYKKRGSVRNENFYFDDYDYAHFTIPWKLGLSLNHSYIKDNTLVGTNNTVLGINAAISPSPYWSLSTNTSYDFVSQRFSQATFNFTRDLRSFNLTFSWVPFGQYKTWNFFIGIKASILSDAVKYDDRSSQLINQSNF
ncbi:hypothetical protein SAMN06296427_103293 [Moheibacter sediminis]|uniref:LPS-assembly protein LptD central domain-containing protein n=1 Tax=Moheibacter sediminis TaxID=1434700 RepID=A0A1W1ZWR3_9FLAO|nr:hypothetical protein SAMN06296427_103293 [Moheibacter sediminis]